MAGSGRAVSRRPRCVLRRALFYNDGGFDVSPCGRFLCSCAELWLPYADQDGEDISIGASKVINCNELFRLIGDCKLLDANLRATIDYPVVAQRVAPKVPTHARQPLACSEAYFSSPGAPSPYFFL